MSLAPFGHLKDRKHFKKNKKKLLTNKKSYVIIRLRKNRKEMMIMEKTYKIVTVENITINIDSCKEVMIEALKDYLYDEYCVDFDQMKPIIDDVIKEITKNI